MQHVDSLNELKLESAWVTIGVFDGVHRGHQALLRSFTQAAHAQGQPAVVVTFWPHPANVLRPGSAPAYLTNPAEKANQMAALGVDVVLSHPFDASVAALPAAAFLAQLRAALGLHTLWVGHDFALGRNREGDIPALQRLGGEMGFDLHVFAPVLEASERISSSRIRALLQAGQIQEANHLLGYPYRVSGLVVEGARRGRTIGIPTANLSPAQGKLVPQNGVYACQAETGSKTVAAVTNIGVRPTFDGASNAVFIEAHLLDFTGNLYGSELALTFVQRLRPEQRFAGVDALVAQIQQDIAAARSILA